MRAALEQRNVHAEVLKYCQAEFIQENYFHAVLEALKGIAERVRALSGPVSDGAELVNAAFGVKAPILSIKPARDGFGAKRTQGIRAVADRSVRDGEKPLSPRAQDYVADAGGRSARHSDIDIFGAPEGRPGQKNVAFFSPEERLIFALTA
jgi:hypothetical protein